MNRTSNTNLHSPAQSASVISVAVLVGAICLSIADALPGGLDGTWAFILGFAIAFIILTAIRVTTTRSSAERIRLSQSEKEKISALAVAVSTLQRKGSGSAEWK